MFLNIKKDVLEAAAQSTANWTDTKYLKGLWKITLFLCFTLVCFLDAPLQTLLSSDLGNWQGFWSSSLKEGIGEIREFFKYFKQCVDILFLFISLTHF